MSIFATAFIEPGSGDVAFLLSSSIDDADHCAVIKKDNTVLVYDPIKQRSIYASSHIGITSSSIICCHATECKGKDCHCLEISMQLASSSVKEKCSSILTSSLSTIPGKYTIIKTSEDDVTVAMSGTSGNLSSSTSLTKHHYMHLKEGKHFFFMKDWEFCYESAADPGQGINCGCQGSGNTLEIPLSLQALGNKWLRGQDSAMVTSAITQSLQHLPHSSPQHELKQGSGSDKASTATATATSTSTPTRVSPANITAVAIEDEAACARGDLYPMSLLANASSGRHPEPVGPDQGMRAPASGSGLSPPRGNHAISLLRATNIATLWYQPPARVTELKVAPAVGLGGGSPQKKVAAELPSPAAPETQSVMQLEASLSVFSQYSKQNVLKMKPPKGYISAFNFYVRTTRPEMVQAYPEFEFNNNALNKKLGLSWRGMDTMARSPYEAMSECDKERYRAGLEEYNSIMSATGNEHRVVIPRVNNHKGAGTSGTNSSATSTSTRSTSSSTSTVVSAWQGDRAATNSSATFSDPVDEIYRPRTAYSHFSRQEKQFVSALSGEAKMQKVTGKFFSARWNFMSPEQKRLYSLLEEDDRVEAQRLHMSKRTKA